MCNGTDLSHWSALSQCFKVRNNCGFDTYWIRQLLRALHELLRTCVRKWKKCVAIEVSRFQLLRALKPDFNWFWTRHGFDLDIIWMLNHKQAAIIINIGHRLERPDKNGFSDKCVRIRIIDYIYVTIVIKNGKII